jgi:hypothetical protein
MQYTANASSLFFSQNGHHLIMGIPIMNNQRFVECAGQADVLAENLALSVAGRTVTVEIEPSLANRNHLVNGFDHATELFHHLIIDGLSIVWMDADTGVDV